jgi:hypothetical protein
MSQTYDNLIKDDGVSLTVTRKKLSEMENNNLQVEINKKALL